MASLSISVPAPSAGRPAPAAESRDGVLEPPSTLLLTEGEWVRYDLTSTGSGPLTFRVEVYAEASSALWVTTGGADGIGYTLSVAPGGWQFYTLPALFDAGAGSLSLWVKAARGQVLLRRIELTAA